MEILNHSHDSFPVIFIGIFSGNYDIHHGILGAYGSILFSDKLTHSTNTKIICILVANKHWQDGFSKHKQT